MDNPARHVVPCFVMPVSFLQGVGDSVVMCYEIIMHKL